MKVAIIGRTYGGRVNLKRGRAGEVFNSAPRFGLTLQFAQAFYDRVYVLFEEEGLVSPEDEVWLPVSPARLTRMCEEERENFRRKAVERLARELAPGDHVSFFTNRQAMRLITRCPGFAWSHDYPLGGLKASEMMRLFRKGVGWRARA